ncbi:visceral mesodermal armadillo-repeats [Brevipalpus obovatus]|uniref:visceral mesodermal armadillo-repeats n=1 Tax=Brevipalpus obovatus TaxID=246614 RepID=UPI003D9F5321
MDDIVKRAISLSHARSQNNNNTYDKDQVIDLCDHLVKFVSSLNDEDVERERISQAMLDKGLLDVLKDPKLLAETNSSLSDEYFRTIYAQTIAELAKVEFWRIPLSDPGIMRFVLSSIRIDEKNIPTIIQVCRAVGNTCCDNDIGRSTLSQLNGIQRMIDLLKTLFVNQTRDPPSANILSKDSLDQSSPTPTLPENSEEIPKTESIIEKRQDIDGIHIDHKLISTLSGCLFNVINGYEYGQEIAIKEDIISDIVRILSHYWTQLAVDDTRLPCLLILHCLIDTNLGRQQMLSTKITSDLVSILKQTNVDDESSLTSLLEMLTSLCEDDEVKLHLVRKEHIDSILINILDMNNCDQTLDSEVTKLILDLLILILTHDTCMDLLFRSGSGTLYKQCLNWLEQEKDYHQLVSSILAIGNFARNDINSAKIVQDNVHQTLFKILVKEAKVDGDLRIQHACLSALRNLSIPCRNKAIIAAPGGNLIRVLREMSAIKTHPVVFKLLATLRMLTADQEHVATELGTDELFLERIIDWSINEDHPGVKAESARLLTWIIKNSKCRTVVDNIVELNGVHGIIEMISCGIKCGIMQNEAFLALILLFASTNPLLEDLLIEGQLGYHTHLFLTSMVHEDICEEILSNFITLLHLISGRSIKLKNHLIQQKILTDLQNIPINGCSNINSKLNTLMAMLGENQ